jgi:hypothetical protein
MNGKLVCLSVVTLIGLPLFGDPAPELTTPLETYRCYVHDTIASRWYSEMTKNDKGGLRYGKVKIRFTVHSDGSVSNFAVVVGDSSGLLKTVTLYVIQESAPFKPFGPDLIKEMGNSYVDDYTFEVTRRKNGMTAEEAKHRVPLPPPD